ALDEYGGDGLAALDEPLDGVGDLVLALRARLEPLDRVVDAGVEDVDARHREVARRLRWLLDESADAAVLDHGDAQGARVGNLDEGQHRVDAGAGVERVGEG